MGDKNNWMQQAIKLAEENVMELRGGPFGAVIVKDGQVIAAAANNVTANNDPTAHAEVEAIRKACKVLNTFELSGCEIYTSCEPCPMCLSAIYWARLDKIYFAADKFMAADAGFDDQFIYEEIDKDPADRSIEMKQLKLQEAQQPFDAWKVNEDKIPY